MKKFDFGTPLDNYPKYIVSVELRDKNGSKVALYGQQITKQCADTLSEEKKAEALHQLSEKLFHQILAVEKLANK